MLIDHCSSNMVSIPQLVIHMGCLHVFFLFITRQIVVTICQLTQIIVLLTKKNHCTNPFDKIKYEQKQNYKSSFQNVNGGYQSRTL